METSVKKIKYNDNTQTHDTQIQNTQTHNLQTYRRRVKALMKKPQPEQRTPEWYKQRYTRVTASEAASCLTKCKMCCEDYVNEFDIQDFKYKEDAPVNPYENKQDYIIKKCRGFYGEQVFRDNVFTLWGKKYEDVAIRIYTRTNKTKVHEFGLISHPRLKWLAASPDGITTDGVMVEIKCPKSRKINPEFPPYYYWVQVQIQLEVCNLQYCDFFECEIEEVTFDEFCWKALEQNQDKGIILQIAESGSDPKFIYPDPYIDSVDDYINWMENEIKIGKERGIEYIPTYFIVNKYNSMRITRNRDWFDKNKHLIKDTWELIMRLQKDEDDFKKYRESVELIKNKQYIELFHKTDCNINDYTSSFEMDVDSEQEQQQETNDEENEYFEKQPKQSCLLDSSEEDTAKDTPKHTQKRVRIVEDQVKQKRDTGMCLLSSSE